MSTRRRLVSLAGVLICASTVGAQTQQPPDRTGDQKNPAMAGTISVTGCVFKESDVLKRDVVTGTAGAIGMRDEFVIARASIQPKDAATAQRPIAGDARAAETGAAEDTPGSFGKVYRATGDKEEELKNYVGQRVQIVGTFKHAEDATRELGATGTSGRAPAGGYTTDNTPEVTITSITPAGGTCAPAGIK